MIRLCPLPYSISNGAISTFPTVQPQMYALATAIVTPKLLIHIFIGSRLAAIAKSGGKMDSGTKAINWASIIGGAIIGAVTGWLIYRRYQFPQRHFEPPLMLFRTVARSQQLEAEERNNVRRSTSQAPEFSDDANEQQATATLLRDDQIDFLDGEGARGDYQDEFSDDEDNVFRYDDGAEEEGAIGLGNQAPKR